VQEFNAPRSSWSVNQTSKLSSGPEGLLFEPLQPFCSMEEEDRYCDMRRRRRET